MKCHNCDFESETNFCPMCGAKMNSQPVVQTSPQPSVPFTQNIPNTQTQTLQNNPYAQNTPDTPPNIQVSPYMANPRPVQQNVPNNPYMQNQPNVPTPNNMQSATPPYKQPQKPKNKANGGVVIAVILGAVILLGTIIFSYSCVSDIFFVEEEKNTTFEFEPDFNDYHTGDTAKTSYGNISLKSMEEVSVVDKSDVTEEDSYNNSHSTDFEYQYKITFSIENTSKDTITVSANDFSVSYDGLNSDNTCPKIAKIEDTHPQSASIKSGESKDFSIYHYVSADAYNLITEYRYSDDAKNTRYLVGFSDYIEYTTKKDDSGNIAYPYHLPIDPFLLSKQVEKAENGDSGMIYTFTFKIINNSTKNIEVSSKDYAIHAHKEFYYSPNDKDKHICTITNDEIIEVDANQSKEITVTCEIPNDYRMLYIYYKLNNHITNPDEPVSDTNYTTQTTIYTAQ